jgi:hypothetical protein
LLAIHVAKWENPYLVMLSVQMRSLSARIGMAISIARQRLIERHCEPELDVTVNEPAIGVRQIS